MNIKQQIQTLPTQLPQTPNMPQIPLDPSNPLVWILLLTALISALDEPINAIANLLRALRNWRK